VELQSRQAEFTKLDASLIALSVDSVDDSKALSERESLSMPILSDPDRAITKAFGLDDPANEISWPAVYVLARDGTVAWRVVLEGYKERPPADDILAAVADAAK
jgi:peroxiredoxin